MCVSVNSDDVVELQQYVYIGIGVVNFHFPVGQYGLCNRKLADFICCFLCSMIFIWQTVDFFIVNAQYNYKKV